MSGLECFELSQQSFVVKSNAAEVGMKNKIIITLANGTNGFVCGVVHEPYNIRSATYVLHQTDRPLGEVDVYERNGQVYFKGLLRKGFAPEDLEGCHLQ